jgi:hypothetical protein
MSFEEKKRKIPVYCWRCSKLIRYEAQSENIVGNALFDLCDECRKNEYKPKVDELTLALDSFHNTVTNRLNDYNKIFLTICEIMILLNYSSVLYDVFHVISSDDNDKIREAVKKRFNEVKDIVGRLINIEL